MKRSALWHPKTADLWLTKWDEDHFVCWVRSGFKLTSKSRLSLEIKAGRRRWNVGRNLANFCCSDHCKNARFLDLDAPSYALILLSLNSAPRAHFPESSAFSLSSNINTCYRSFYFEPSQSTFKRKGEYWYYDYSVNFLLESSPMLRPSQ